MFNDSIKSEEFYKVIKENFNNIKDFIIIDMDTRNLSNTFKTTLRMTISEFECRL